MDIKKGDVFKCLENVFAHDNREIRFNANKEYLSYEDGCIRDNAGVNYSINNEGFLKRHFSKINSLKTIDDKLEDKVNHPSHYTWLRELCGIEVIDITRHLSFDRGNAVKYLLRAGHKPEEGYSERQKLIEDLKKAIWYINDEIKQLENGKVSDSRV